MIDLKKSFIMFHSCWALFIEMFMYHSTFFNENNNKSKNKSPTFGLIIHLLFVPLEFSVKFKKTFDIWQIFLWPIIWHSIGNCLTLASEFPMKWRSNNWDALRRIYTTFLFRSIKSEMFGSNYSLFGWHSQNILNVYSFWQIVVVFSDFLSTFTCIHI